MAICPLCKTENMPGTRWCNICHTNILNQEVGKLASPKQRLGAFLIDMLFAIAFYFFCILWYFSFFDSWGDTQPWVLFYIIFSLVYIFYYIKWTLDYLKKGSSIGKHCLGMRVIEEDGRNARFFTMLIRSALGKVFISALFFSLGFLWILFDKENQCWHDKLMSTYVVTN